MKNHTEQEIEDKVKEIWDDEFFYDEEKTMERVQPPTIEVKKIGEKVSIKIERMYEAPGLSFSRLKLLSEFFETENINDPDTFAYGGCETCDYGSSYGFTLEIW